MNNLLNTIIQGDNLKYPDDYINKIIYGDCLEVMKGIPDKSVDLVLTDPPYGVKADKGVGGFGVSKHTVRKYQDSWDNSSPSLDYFTEILRVAKESIIFGGNYFTDKLPVSRGWQVWDKVGNNNFKNPYSQVELIYTTFNTVNKKYTVIQQGFIAYEKDRFHPTQKPVELIRALLIDYSKKNDLVLDPFLGSGTTAVACKELGRRFIGIEINPKYCEIAQRRLAQEYFDF